MASRKKRTKTDIDSQCCEKSKLKKEDKTPEHQGDPSQKTVIPIVPLTTNHVIVRAHPDKGLVRENIYEFMHPIRYNKDPTDYQNSLNQRDLFLQAFEIFKEKHSDDPRSFFQIAGIHGWPYSPYDNVIPPQKETNEFMGYCCHGSTLFPTWHRPYVLLLEQEIIECALQFIDDPDNGVPDIECAKGLARRMRLPYWDWADYRTQAEGIPSYFTDEKVVVRYPLKKTIPNPLCSFVFPMNVIPIECTYALSAAASPTSKPKYEPAEVKTCPLTPAMYPTIRHPTSAYDCDIGNLRWTVMQQCNTVFRPGVCNMFLTDKWIRMASHFGDSEADNVKNYGVYSSLEVVHDAVHDAVGGQAGHMSYTSVSSFDPIFFFHHCNVDRLLALWQCMHPNEWVTESEAKEPTYAIYFGEKLNEHTPLYPFRKSAHEFWNSADIRNYTELGYSYPEITNPVNPKDFLEKELKYYAPMWWAGKRREIRVYNIPKYKFHGSYKLLIFVACKADDVISGRVTKKDANYAGYIFIFSPGKYGMKRCGTCMNNKADGKGIVKDKDVTRTYKILRLNAEQDFGKDNQPKFDMAFVAEVTPGKLVKVDEVKCFWITREKFIPSGEPDE